MKKSIIIILTGSLLVLSSCFPYSKMFSEDLDKLVPADFGEQTTTIVVEKSKDRINKIYKKSFDEKYKGAYLIASKEEINTLYMDKDKYRYQLGFSEGYSNIIDTKYKQYYNVYLLDRKTGKDYTERDLSGSLFEKHIKAYLTKLEQARKK